MEKLCRTWRPPCRLFSRLALLALLIALGSSDVVESQAKGMRKGMHKGMKGMHRGMRAMHKRKAGMRTHARTKPNIIFILGDDQDVLLGGSSNLPKIGALLQKQGATFENFVVNYALCCPSRATILTGKCMHNTRVLTNQNPDGGYGQFTRLGHHTRTMGTYLQALGYRTGLIGKYLNGYKGSGKIPPGWDRWFAFVNDRYGFYDWAASDQGRLKVYGNKTADYSTDVFTQKAVEFINGYRTDKRPFFLYLAPFAPHQPAIPADRHIGKLAGLKVPRTPNFNPPDRSQLQKVWAARLYPSFQPRIVEMFDFYHQMRAESMLAVDDMVGTVIDTLTAVGALANTYVFQTSDNGYHLGQHRLGGGKQTPYENDIRVPFSVRGPGVPKGVTLPHLVGNIDLLPTFVELARGTIPATNPIDGISFVRLLRPGGAVAVPPEAFRTAFLIEKISLLDNNSSSAITQPSRRRLLATAGSNWHAAVMAAGKDGEGFLDPLAEFRQIGVTILKRARSPNDGLNGVRLFPNCINDGSDFGPGGRLTQFQCAVLYANFRVGNYAPRFVASTYGRDSAEKYVMRGGFNPIDYVIANGFSFPTTYYALRVATSSGHFKYIRFPVGYELYNLTSDPYELSNIYRSAPRRLVTGLESVLNTLIRCRGASCTVRGKMVLGL